MGVRRRAGVVLVATSVGFAGCGLLSGADDLEVGPSLGEADAEVEATSTARLDASDGSSPLDALVDVATADAGASDGGRLREVTFENGTLIGAKGGDSVTGSVQIESLNPVAGLHSMRVDKNGSYLQTNIAPASEVFATFLVRVENLALGNLSMAQLVAEGAGPLVELIPSTNIDTLEITVGGTSIGTGGVLTDNGEVYRIGLHVRQGTGTGLVEVFVSKPGVAFGAPVIRGTTLTIGRTAAVRIGAIKDGDMKLYLDDLLLDSASMPPP